ncbi:MAG: radical SAM protein [Acidobacteria bacterium]|nr:radical SAM protein [Acidobacteriota bacterium]
MQPYRPEKVYVERSVESSPVTSHVLEASRGVPVAIIDSIDVLLEESKRWNPAIAKAKRYLLLAKHRGKFFKPCPGRSTRPGAANVCCNYFVINYASNCHMECSYCYLQSYLNFPYLTIYANLPDLLSELEEVFTANPHQQFRVGTGELADSLALDPLTAYSTFLVSFFSRRPNAVLELKTKSNCVERLLDIDHRGRTVVSWSVAPSMIQMLEEHKTASMDQRLQAASLCARAGYPVAFHLDPMIHYSEWEEGYKDLIAGIFDTIPPESIAWISLGSLRLTPALKQIMRERFPKSFLPLGELVPCEDGKLRYFKPLRVEMYARISGWIRERFQKTPVYMCMERPEIWEKVFGGIPSSEENLGNQLLVSLE